METEYDFYKKQYDDIMENRHQEVLELLKTQRQLCRQAFEREWKEYSNTFDSIGTSIENAELPKAENILSVISAKTKKKI